MSEGLFSKIRGMFSSKKEEPVEVPENELEKQVKLYGLKDIPSVTPEHLYVPTLSSRNNIIEKVAEYWNSARPKSAFDYVVAATSTVPGLSGASSLVRMWKMPENEHAKLNNLLASAYALSKVHPVAQTVTGLTYAVSQAIYGLKTGQGAHILSGLKGILTHTDKMAVGGLQLKDRAGARRISNGAQSLLETMVQAQVEKN
ncbi:MAG: hypothetical protein AABX11_02485 [Nanoarchaeota archaeon]